MKLPNRLGKEGSHKPHPSRRLNPTARHRSKNISWCPDDDAIVRECLENWLIPIDAKRLSKYGGASLVCGTGRVLLKEFVRWAKENNSKMPEEFFRSTPYGQALEWFKNLHLQKFEDDARRAEVAIYGKKPEDEEVGCA